MYRKFIQDNVYQISPESTGFCGRYDKTFWCVFFGSQCSLVFLFSGKTFRIETVVGETVHLACGDAETLHSPVDWHYQKAMDARGHNVIISEGYLINGDFGGRLNINGSTLIITNAKKDDSGVYICVEELENRHHVVLTVQGKLSK